jgi:hypothetical protein
MASFTAPPFRFPHRECGTKGRRSRGVLKVAQFPHVVGDGWQDLPYSADSLTAHPRPSAQPTHNRVQAEPRWQRMSERPLSLTAAASESASLAFAAFGELDLSLSQRAQPCFLKPLDRNGACDQLGNRSGVTPVRLPVTGALSDRLSARYQGSCGLPSSTSGELLQRSWGLCSDSWRGLGCTSTSSINVVGAHLCQRPTRPERTGRTDVLSRSSWVSDISRHGG